MTDQTPWTTARIADIMRTLADEDDLPGHIRTAQITGLDTVETLGLDSLGAVYLVERLEIEAGVDLPDDFLAFEDSIETIAGRMNKLLGGKA